MRRTVSNLGVSIVFAAAAAAFVPSAGSSNALDHLRTTDDIGLNKVPNRGKSRILVIPVRVGDSLADYELEALEENFDPSAPPGSFRHFWRTTSRGLYDPEPFLVDEIFYPTCPLPDIGSACRLGTDDWQVLTSGAVRDLLVEILERVRDEQQLDLTQFDINAAGCPHDDVCPDGYFDGIILASNMFQGIAFPIAALGQPVTVSSAVQPLPTASPDGGSTDDAGATVDGGSASLDAGTPADGGAVDAGPVDAGGASTDGGATDGGTAQGPMLTAGIMALVPPANHEFGHVLGFIDNYAGPTLNGLMSEDTTSLSAFSRLQIGWGEAEDVEGPGTYVLEPVYDSGRVLRFGSPPRYVLLENRGGPLHDDIDASPPGLYLHSVDEDQLPTTPLGFFNVLGGYLYYPNEFPPYLNITMPFECRLFNGPNAPEHCVLARPEEGREVEHIADGHLGFHVVVKSIAEDGSVTIEIGEGRLPEPTEDAGVPADAGGGDDTPDAGADAVDAGTETGDTCACDNAGGSGSPFGLAAVFATGFALRRRRRTR